MEKQNTVNILNSKLDEYTKKYLEVIMMEKENPKNADILNALCHLKCEIKYIKKFLSIINIDDEITKEKEVDKNNFIKGLVDLLYEKSERQSFPISNKIKIVESETTEAVES